MNEQQKIIFEMSICNNLINVLGQYKEDEPITPEMLKDILRENKAELEKKLIQTIK